MCFIWSVLCKAVLAVFFGDAIMKKLIVALAALVLTIGFSIGCGKKEAPKPVPPTDVETPAVQAPGVQAPAAPEAAAPAAPAPAAPAPAAPAAPVTEKPAQ
jgi:hypothetical protein